MDLTTYVEGLRRELAEVAELGGPESRALAERLAGALDSAIRLALLDALAGAADEITRDLAPGSVQLHLSGREPRFVVTPPPGDGPPPVAPETVPAPTAPETDDSTTARISFRLPEQLKSRIEEAAARDGLSVNAWLVRATGSAVAGPATAGPPPRRAAWGGDRWTGWAQ